MTLRIRHKVLLPALAVILVLLGLAAYSFYSIWQIDLQTSRLRDILIPGTASMRQIRVQLEEIIRFGEIANVKQDPEYLEGYNATRAQLDRELARLVEREPTGKEAAHRKFESAMSRLYAALEPGDPEAAAGLEEAKREARAMLRDLEDHYAHRLKGSVQRVSGIATDAARSTLYALVAGLLLSVVVWVLILWSLSRPLRNLVEGTERVAQGRFDESIPVLSQDELGTLSGAFNRMAASLSELDRMKAEFVAAASHELKTPLACIKGFAALLRSDTRGPLSDEQKATLLQVEEQVDQMTSFVSQLLDLSRLRAGRAPLNVRSLPAEAFFGSVARGFEGVAERKGIRYDIRISQDLPPRIQVDPDRLREVVYNLLGNAFKFTDPGGRVGFEADAESDWVRVSVSDTGPGIRQEDLPFIFERYYRGAESDGNRRNEGAGLGLAISRGIVEKHGGRIWVESNSGSGSRFIFRIPAAASAQQERPALTD